MSSVVERSALPLGLSKTSPILPVMSSVVETSLRLAACAKRRIYEISPCASLTSSNSVASRDSQSELCSPLAAPSLSRDDKRKKTVEMTGKEDSENYRITKLQLQLGFLGKIDKKS